MSLKYLDRVDITKKWKPVIDNMGINKIWKYRNVGLFEIVEKQELDLDSVVEMLVESIHGLPTESAEEIRSELRVTFSNILNRELKK